MKIDLNRLTRRAVLFQSITTRDATNGEVLKSFLAVGTRWCDLLSLLPSEIELQAQLSSRAVVKCLLRLDAIALTITPEWRVAIEDTTYEVVGTDPNRRDRSTKLYLAGVR